jgi:hypothetical protein
MDILEWCGLGPAVAHKLIQHHGDWVADFDASHHITPSVGNIFKPHLKSFNPSSIVVGNDYSLPITSIDDSIFPGPFYLNNILVAPDIVQSLLSIHHFTTDGSSLPITSIGTLWNLTHLICL